MEDFELLLYDRIEIIKQTIQKYGEENFYISFSGGKDSTVLHHLIDEAIPDNKIPRVFINTGIEYNEIRRFVEKLTENDCRFVIFNSGVNIKEMLNEKGYPFKSKEHSCKLSMFQKKGTETKSVSKYINEKSFGCPDVLKYQFTDDFNLKDKNFYSYVQCGMANQTKSLNVNELKAVQQQMNELGWI